MKDPRRAATAALQLALDQAVDLAQLPDLEPGKSRERVVGERPFADMGDDLERCFEEDVEPWDL